MADTVAVSEPSVTAKMGAWGLCLFQSDGDLDIVCDLDVEAGLEEAVKCTNEGGYVSMHNPHDPEAVRKHLDSGVLERLVKQQKGTNLYAFVLLGALAMELGCHLPDGFRDDLEAVYEDVLPYDEGIEQMRYALKVYKDGTPHELGSKGLMDTVSTGNPYVEWGQKEIDAGEFEHPADACGACGAKESKDGAKLLLCSKCSSKRYCDKECQKAHWKKHKIICGKKKVVRDLDTGKEVGRDEE